MALFRRVHRMFRRRLCLLFVLVWIATVFLCGLEVMKFNTTLKKPGLFSLRKTSKHYEFMDRQQHQRHRVAKDSRIFSLSGGFRKDHSKLMIDKDEDSGLDKRIERDDGVPMGAKETKEQNSDGDENLGEYEEELDWAGIKNTGINIDSPDDIEDHQKDEEKLEVKAQEEQEQQHRYEEFVEEEATYGEELEGEEFEKEEEINEKKQGEEKQSKREEQEEEKEEKVQQEQNYAANVKHAQHEKYKKGNGETNEENDYFPQHKYKEDETEDPDKGVDEHEEKDDQAPRKTQNVRNQNDDQGQQDGQDESEVLGEQDDEEEENYHKLVNQSERLKSEQRPEKQIKEKAITQKYKESMKHDHNKQASNSKTQLFNSNHEQTERSGALLETMIKPTSVLDESKANDKSSVAPDVKDSVYLPPLKRVEGRVEPQTDRTEGDVKFKEDGHSTEVNKMDKEDSTINREAGQETDNAAKSKELANQLRDETGKKSYSDGKGLQGYKTTKESVENERNKERQDEVHKYGTSVTENKETAEQAKDDGQRTANEDGKARIRINEQIEPEDEQSKVDMKYQDDKLNEEGQRQFYEGKRKRNDSGNENKHKLKNESERSHGTENGNGSKENKANQEKQRAVEENHATNKRKGEDVERYQAEERLSSKSTSLPWTGQPLVSPKEDGRDHQQHGKEIGHGQDSFEINKTNSRERNVRLAQRTAKPTMSEELLLRRQDERKLTINRFCQKQKVTGLPNRRNLENLVVIDQAQIIYCAIPKVASTEWREALSVELGHGRIQGKKVQNRTLWKHLNEYSIQNITEKLKKFHKFLFVREPFARLLSAYKSKFVASNEYYFKTYGRKIIQDFRKDATEHAKNSGDDVTFLEFIKYIAVTRFYDEHWRPYDQICHMCSVDYNFIGHLETIEEDAPFFLNELGIDDYVTFKSSRHSHTSSELLKYYSQIPASYIKRLRIIYFKDFEMFGYPFPGPLKSIIEDST